MENPKFDLEKKTRLLESQLHGLHPAAMNLARILTSRSKFSLITEISEEYQNLLDDLNGIEKAEITTAVQIDENEKRKIAEYLGRITGKRVVLTEKVDPSIIGGVIARVGGKIIDGSTRNQLNSLKNELANAER
jgi:F-type H+-transporting ATPase subunit delta